MSIYLSAKYDLRVPRYTSYPTTPHFGPAIDRGRYRAWLAELDPAFALSLYIHIPFCDEMCWFCGCYTKIVNQYEPIRAYLVALQREIALVAEALPARFGVRHLHFGGGSPTMLAPEDWLALIELLRRRFDFAADAEIAVELDPRDATEEYVAALAEAGVNRASIGVQDFDPNVQRAINRLQPFEVVGRVVGWLRRHGIYQINLDLMYGLPLQTEAKVLAMVDRAITLAPSRVALFGYAHVPWMRTHQRLIDEAQLPGAAERLRQFAAASQRLRDSGFRPIGLDHFARPDDKLSAAFDDGRLCRNFQGYTADDAPVLLGFGASSIGSLPHGYVQNAQPLADYRRAVDNGRLPAVRGVALSAEDRLRRDVIVQLMCRLEVDLETVCRQHGVACQVFTIERRSLEGMAEDGLVELDGAAIRVTEAGRPFVRAVAARFDAYLQRGGQRHSRAV
jgi:oxygen-independent coproporphyrinogen-3 oxidase